MQLLDSMMMKLQFSYVLGLTTILGNSRLTRRKQCVKYTKRRLQMAAMSPQEADGEAIMSLLRPAPSLAPSLK